MARAAASLGVARGVGAFQRFGYIERNGRSYLAVSLGCFRVPAEPPKLLALLDELDVWLARLRRQARDRLAPARLRMAERRLAVALFAVVRHADEPARWQRVLLALADVEAVFVSGSGFGAGPVPSLSPGWADAANDGSGELRLALALALQGSRGDGRRWDGVRRHWLPLDDRGGRFATTGDATHPRLQQKPEVVMRGRHGVSDAIALVERRLVEAARHGTRNLPLAAAPGAAAGLDDLAALVGGELDVDRTLALARALMALDSGDWRGRSSPLSRPERRPAWPDDGWLVIRLALLPWKLDERALGADPAIVRRLAAGDAAAAFRLASRRLAAAGIHPPLRASAADRARARRWAAALAFPISKGAARAIARRLDPALPGKGTEP